MSKFSKAVKKTVGKPVYNVVKKVATVNVATAAGVVGGFVTGGPVGAIAGGAAGAVKGVVDVTKVGGDKINITKTTYQAAGYGAASGFVTTAVAGYTGQSAAAPGNYGAGGKFGAALKSFFGKAAVKTATESAATAGVFKALGVGGNGAQPVVVAGESGAGPVVVLPNTQPDRYSELATPSTPYGSASDTPGFGDALASMMPKGNTGVLMVLSIIAIVLGAYPLLKKRA